MKKVLLAFLYVLIALFLAVVCLFGWLTAKEFKPAPVEELIVTGTGSSPSLQPGQSLRILSWNVGYGGLGAGSDFFMDGGKNVKAAGPNAVGNYLNGIKAELYADPAPDLLLLQEVDTNSSRTYGIDEAAYLSDPSRDQMTVHALNYSCPFVPYPMPPIGKVNSGLFTLTGYGVDRAERIALPCPFSWPVSTANLKRCLLVSYLPIEGTEQQLVLVNLHLEAYDDGEGKIAQTNQLRQFIQAEYDKGNYVIAGGDFNQIFPGGLEAWPNAHPELWQPGILDDSLLPQGWSFQYDLKTPSCRLLNQPYDPADTVNTQYYVIDGFIVSPNVTVDDVETLDLGFANSDHNPVRLQVTLK